VFNFGGGPGIRVHQFGGARPRRRPRDAQNQQEQNPGLQNLLGLLPIILFFVLPMISSLFSGGSSNAIPSMTFDKPHPPYTHARTLPQLDVKYFVNPADISTYSSSALNRLDRQAQDSFIRRLNNDCDNEIIQKRRLREAAQGWFFQDPERMAEANARKMPSCERLQTLGIGRTAR
jgi:DnaJ homolog subfamily B member 12